MQHVKSNQRHLQHTKRSWQHPQLNGVEWNNGVENEWNNGMEEGNGI